MRHTFFGCLLAGFALLGCGERPHPPVRSAARQYTYARTAFGQLPRKQRMYVPIYAEVLYNNSTESYYPLLTTLSVRNTSLRDSLYVNVVDYYDTGGQRLRQYLTKPIVLRPLESVDFPVTYADKGGIGANFIVEWGATGRVTPPMVQAVTVGSAYSMGFSWVTDGVPTDSL